MQFSSNVTNTPQRRHTRDNNKNRTKFHIGGKSKKKFDFLQDDWGDPTIEKSEPLLNLVFSKDFIYEQPPVRRNKIREKVQDFMRSRVQLLNELWERYDVPWNHRQDIMSKGYRDGMGPRNWSQQYKDVSKETLRLLGQRPVIKGLIDQREDIMSQLKAMKRLELTINAKQQLVEKIQIYRTVTLYIIEQIQKWHDPEGGRKQYMWKGIDYFVKMVTDFSDLCKSHKQILHVMKQYKYRLSPLGLPMNGGLYSHDRRLEQKRGEREKGMIEASSLPHQNEMDAEKKEESQQPTMNNNNNTNASSFFITETTGGENKEEKGEQNEFSDDEEDEDEENEFGEGEREGEEDLEPEEKLHLPELEFRSPESVLTDHRNQKILEKRRKLLLQQQRKNMRRRLRIVSRDNSERNVLKSRITSSNQSPLESVNTSPYRSVRQLKENLEQQNFHDEQEEESSDDERFSSLQDVSRMPPLLVVQKYSDIFNKKRRKYQHPLIQLRHDDLLSQIENGVAIEKARRWKKMLRKNKALRTTNQILGEIQRNRKKRKIEEEGRKRRRDMIVMDELDQEIALEEEILREGRKKRGKGKDEKDPVGMGRAGHRRLRLTQRKKHVRSRYRQRKRIKSKRRKVLRFRKPNLQSEYERCQKAESSLVKHYRIMKMKEEIEQHKKLELEMYGRYGHNFQRRNPKHENIMKLMMDKVRKENMNRSSSSTNQKGLNNQNNNNNSSSHLHNTNGGKSGSEGSMFPSLYSKNQSGLKFK